MARAKKKQELGGLAEWIVTYGDMVTLLLCFFVALFDTTDAEVIQINQMISSLNNIGMGASTGGNTLSAGKLAELGNTIGTLPSMERGRLLATAKKKAVSLFQPEIKSNKVRVSKRCLDEKRHNMRAFAWLQQRHCSVLFSRNAVARTPHYG